MNERGFVAVVIVAALVGALFGWVIAHDEVARECERLGAFYVGDQVFSCEAKR